jgi:hypothetical protein
VKPSPLIHPLAFLMLAGFVPAGPYSGPVSDPTKADAGIPGFIGPDGDGLTGLDGSPGAANRVNPLFFTWAGQVASYEIANPANNSNDDPQWALGPVTGDHFLDTVSLGDLTASGITSGDPPGHITVTLAHPVADLPGADLAVFENGFSIGTQIFGELAYVEVSSDGNHFARFPSRSLVASPVPAYGRFDATDVFNLAGKHANGYGVSWGTPFDLSQLVSHPLVGAGLLNLQSITHVRVVDIPGTGQFFDSHTPPSPIYDPWETFDSGGFDLEAIGGIATPVDFNTWVGIKEIPSDRSAWLDDSDGDGCSNALEFALGREPTRRENAAPMSIRIDSGSVVLEFTRDTRARGLVLEVERSLNLKDWETVARSTDGGEFQVVAPFSPVLSDVSASPVASIGVIRRQTVGLPLSSATTAHFRLAVRPMIP